HAEGYLVDRVVGEISGAAGDQGNLMVLARVRTGEHDFGATDNAAIGFGEAHHGGVEFQHLCHVMDVESDMAHAKRRHRIGHSAHSGFTAATNAAATAQFAEKRPAGSA